MSGLMDHSQSLVDVRWRNRTGSQSVHHPTEKPSDIDYWNKTASAVELYQSGDNDEMLTSENSGLRDRVHELERRVAEQEDELVCFKSSMADVLRRLREVEGGKTKSDPRNVVDQLVAGLPTRNMSRSSGNLRKHASTLSVHTEASSASHKPGRSARNSVSPLAANRTSSALPNNKQSSSTMRSSVTGGLNGAGSANGGSSNNGGGSVRSRPKSIALSNHTTNHGGTSATNMSNGNISNNNPHGPHTFLLRRNGGRNSPRSEISRPVSMAGGLNNPNGGIQPLQRVPGNDYNNHSPQQLQQSLLSPFNNNNNHQLSPSALSAGTALTMNGGEHSRRSSRGSNHDGGYHSRNSATTPSPMNRKWASQADFGGGGQTYSSQTLPSRPRRFGSSNSLASSRLSMSRLADYGVGRDPSYSALEGMLTVHFRNNNRSPINLPAPISTQPDYSPLGPPVPAPVEKLKLEWVYGYRGRDCRNNLFMLPTGEMVYFAATIVTLWNPEDQVQRHYNGHTDDVKCLAVHPNRLTIASGQGAKGGGMKNRKLMSLSDMDALIEESENLPHIRIWDSITLQTQHVIGIGDFERSVTCCSFSRVDGGNLLAAVDESYEHTLSIWDWQRKKKLAETKGANEMVFSVDWHPSEKHLIVTCGKSNISFWNFDGIVLTKRIGIIEGRDKPKYLICTAFTEMGEVLSGDSNGTISVWDHKTGRVVRSAQKAHQGGVFSICCLKGGRLVSGGGKDGRLIEWTVELKPTGNSTQLPDIAGPVRTITQAKGNLILIGTTHNVIMMGSIEIGFKHLLQSHDDELWGVTPHPLQQQFLTVGFDKTLRLWDSISKSMIWMKEIADPARSAVWHPNGGSFVIGTTVGRWIAFDALTRDVILGQKDGSDMISVVSFSPDGSLLAVGSHDGTLYVYSVSADGRKYNRVGKCGPLSMGIMAVDWSTDGQVLRVNTMDMELLHYHAVSCKLMNLSTIRSLQWTSSLCPLHFDSYGIWPENPDGSEIRGCDRSNDAKLMVAACDSGAVQLFSHPTCQAKAENREYVGHSGMVSDIRFTQNDARVISVGGKDNCIMQWKVVKPF